ncbi:MAG: M57 family metalloprotease [Bacteroidales bacterium]|nr:M57 family metalloprotease [Bacteroidales bacterium]
MKNSSFLFIIVAFVMVLYSCEKEEDNFDIHQKTVTSNQDQILEFLQNTGYNSKDIRETDDAYIIQGDMIIPKKHISNNPALKQASIDPNYLLTRTCNPYDVYLAQNTFANIGESLSAVLNNSISQINGIGSFIKLRRVYSSASADIRITQFDFDSDDDPNNDRALGAATLPFYWSNSPGNEVILDDGDLKYFSSDQLFTVITHELLHTVGVHHTDWATAHHPDDYRGAYDEHRVAGTPSVDNSSLMNHATGGQSFTSIPKWDKVALRNMYPALSVNVAGPSCLPLHGGTTSWYAIGVNGNGSYTYRWTYLIRRGHQKLGGIVHGNTLTLNFQPGDKFSAGVLVSSCGETANGGTGPGFMTGGICDEQY